MRFTTRPEIVGDFGVATSTHWIASAVGMGVLERGGNAIDAAVTMGFVLHVVEPHLNGPLGDMPALLRPAGADTPLVFCGQGTAPRRATIDHYRAEGLTSIPGSGLLATVIPGAFDAWMLMLRDHGTLGLREVLEPAIHYAQAGHIPIPRVIDTISALSGFFHEHWPSSAQVWLPGGYPPIAGDRFSNQDLGGTWRRLLAEAESARGREAQIEAARKAFYSGFIAEAIDTFVEQTEAMDASGQRHKGVLSGEDMANWRATTEAPLSTNYNGWQVFKPGAWTQGPSLLQSLQILKDTDIARMDSQGADWVHLVTEALKLSFADREAYYGDPDTSVIPLETLLSPVYAAKRRSQITETASRETRPGPIRGYEEYARAAISRAASAQPAEAGIGAGEPTMAHLARAKGDTVHLDVIDRWGNIVSATPSGGWLQSSPVVSGLGMALNTRAQMFWLDEGLPTSLAPGRRPRTTLSPSMARYDTGAWLSFGTPGGDQQDQWQLMFLLRYLHAGMNLQEAIDAPLFHTGHAQSSFDPRIARPGHLMIEERFSKDVIADLSARGHDVEVSEDWTIGRLTAARRDPDGLLRAAATPRQMQAYAAGR